MNALLGMLGVGGVLAAAVTMGANPTTEGRVVEKHHQAATTRVYCTTAAGSPCSPADVEHRPAEWVLVVVDGHGGSGAVAVDQSTYERLAVGATYTAP